MTTDTIPTTGPQAATDDLPQQIFDLGAAMLRALTPETAFTRPADKPYSIDSDALLAAEAHDWDGVPDGPDMLSLDEAIAALDLHAARAAKNGNYGLHADLTAVRELLDKLAEAGL